MKRVVDWNRRRFGRRLRGRGLEIGALDNPMELLQAKEVLYSDLLTAEQIDELYPGGKHPDIISDSEHFPDLPDDSLDFIVANHVLEHLTDPNRALIEWHRMVRPEGLVMLAVPDKRYIFDFSRRRTSLSHLEADHVSTAPPEDRNACHLREWAEHVERLVPGTAAFDAWMETQMGHGYSVHNHVWVIQDILKLIRHLGACHAVHFRLRTWSNTSLLGNEFVLLLEKCSTHAGRLDGVGLAYLLAALQHPIHELASRAKRLFRRRGRSG
jgi:SAM-dependent methyltransferase